MLKRAILRKDPTFSETTYGFRGFSELLRHLEEQGLVALTPGPGQGDPEVSFPTEAHDEQAAFALLRSVVERLTARSGPLHLSGLKTQLRKQQPDFSEKRFGYGGFLQFVKAAQNRGFVEMERLVLRLRALQYVPAARQLLDDWYAALRLAYQCWYDDPQGAHELPLPAATSDGEGILSSITRSTRAVSVNKCVTTMTAMPSAFQRATCSQKLTYAPWSNPW